LLSRLGVELIDFGVVADTEAATTEAILKASDVADLVITSGGVSAGQADFVSNTIAKLGELTFWKLAMRPGRPLACGVVNDCRFFGLPGNPVAVMVTFYEFVQPTIKAMMGCTETEPPLFTVEAKEAIRKVPGRIEYQRGIVEVSEHGVQTVRTTGKQGAGRLSSMCLANCLIVLPATGIKPSNVAQTAGPAVLRRQSHRRYPVCQRANRPVCVVFTSTQIMPVICLVMTYLFNQVLI